MNYLFQEKLWHCENREVSIFSVQILFCVDFLLFLGDKYANEQFLWVRMG